MGRRIRLHLNTALLVAALAGCSNAQDEAAALTPTPSPPTIAVVPASATIGIGQSIQLSVEVLNVTSAGGYRWETSDDAVVQISASGQATGVAKGRVFVLAKLAADTSIAARAEIIVE